MPVHLSERPKSRSLKTPNAGKEWIKKNSHVLLQVIQNGKATVEDG